MIDMPFLRPFLPFFQAGDAFVTVGKSMKYENETCFLENFVTQKHISEKAAPND